MNWVQRLFRRSAKPVVAAKRAKRPAMLSLHCLEQREVPASISGNVFRDFNNNGISATPDTPLSGISVSITGGTLTTPRIVSTDASGNFTISDLAAGTYTLTATPPNNTVAGRTTAGTAGGNGGTNNIISGVTVTADQTATGYNFGQVPTNITTGGRVFNDKNGNGTQDTGEEGISGVTVRLTGNTVINNTAVTRTATTGENGSYSFTGLQPGTYSITRTLATGFTNGTLQNGTPAATSTANSTFTGIDLSSTAATSSGFNFADVKPTVLTISQSVDNSRARVGDEIVLTLTARNTGTRSAPSVAASVNLDGLTFVSATGTGYNSTTRRWDIGTMTAGQTATLELRLTVPARDIFLPSSRIVSTDTAAGVVGDRDFSTVNSGNVAVSMKSFLASSYRTSTLSEGQNPTYPEAPTGNGTNAPTTPTVQFFAAGTSTPLSGTFVNNTVTDIKGITTPNTPLTLVETNATTTSDSTGAYTFANVPVLAGNNTYTVRAGNSPSTSQGTGTLVGNSAPTISTQQAAVNLTTAAPTQTLDLAGNFTDANLGSTKVKLTTNLGDINIDLLDSQAPRTVANFLNYVTDGDYNNTVFHRSVNNFVVQGGGFTYNAGTTPTITSLATDPAVQNEPDTVNRSNLRGTVAMAKLGGDPNSATNQFFFNLANNASNLDTQNGGFTVFARLSGAADQAVVDSIAALSKRDFSTGSALSPTVASAFQETPVRNYTGTNFPTDTTIANVAAITNASIVSQPEALTYSIVSNSNTAGVTAAIVKNRLTLTAVSGQTGSATITVRATDKAGLTRDMTFTVNLPAATT